MQRYERTLSIVARLATKSMSASALAFSSLSKVLLALPVLGAVNEDLVLPVLRLWADYLALPHGHGASNASGDMGGLVET